MPQSPPRLSPLRSSQCFELLPQRSPSPPRREPSALQMQAEHEIEQRRMRIERLQRDHDAAWNRVSQQCAARSAVHPYCPPLHYCYCYPPVDVCSTAAMPLRTSPSPKRPEPEPVKVEEPEPPKKEVSPAKKSPSKNYLKWTTTFARSTVHWDKKEELLDWEKPEVPEPVKPTKRCCGNSPGKTDYRDHEVPPEAEFNTSVLSRSKSIASISHRERMNNSVALSKKSSSKFNPSPARKSAVKTR